LGGSPKKVEKLAKKGLFQRPFAGQVSGSKLNLKPVLGLYFSKSWNHRSRKFNFHHSFENGICDISDFQKTKKVKK
jgi:hypothetical protein